MSTARRACPKRSYRTWRATRDRGPVRVGNDAHGQLQLDVYGEVLDAVARFARGGGRFDRDTVRLLDGLGHTVCQRWREPDEGIWEGRSGRFHHTHSKALCWVALDRLLQMHAAGQIQVCVDQFRAEREAIRAEIEAHGYNPRLRSYTRTFDGDTLDASLLVLPLYGYVDGDAPADARHLRAHPRAAWPRWPGLPLPGGHRRRAAARRGRVRHLQLLGGGVPGAGRRPGGGQRRPSSSFSATRTTSGCSPRRSTRTAAPRSGTSPRRSRTSA